MAEFLPAYERTILNEGGYVLHRVKGDTGGQTYAGIARNHHPRWPGWQYIDDDDTPSADLVRDFYRTHFWTPLRADRITHQAVARSLFDFAVNAGPATAAKLAQVVAGVTPDGKIGPVTLDALNDIQPDLFLARYALAKIARYEQIITRNRSQEKFLLGWIRRTLREAA